MKRSGAWDQCKLGWISTALSTRKGDLKVELQVVSVFPFAFHEDCSLRLSVLERNCVFVRSPFRYDCHWSSAAMNIARADPLSASRSRWLS